MPASTGPQMVVRCTTVDHPKASLASFLQRLQLATCIQVVVPCAAGKAALLCRIQETSLVLPLARKGKPWLLCSKRFHSKPAPNMCRPWRGLRAGSQAGAHELSRGATL